MLVVFKPRNDKKTRYMYTLPLIPLDPSVTVHKLQIPFATVDWSRSQNSQYWGLIKSIYSYPYVFTWFNYRHAFNRYCPKNEDDAGIDSEWMWSISTKNLAFAEEASYKGYTLREEVDPHIESMRRYSCITQLVLRPWGARPL